MKSFKASAPGSLMLLGEYAVLHDYPALVCAVDKRMQVTLHPREDEIINITSTLGRSQTSIKKIEVVAPFAFVLTTLKQFQKHLQTGCDIVIESEFSHQVGFASSAAVTVATLAAVTAWLQLNYTSLESVLLSRHIVQKVQGVGSGADVAACTFGGLLTYRMQPLAVDPIETLFPLTVLYSGSKTPTTQVIQQVTQCFAKHKHLLQRLLQAVGECAAEGREAALKQDWVTLGRLMNVQQGLMQALGVNTPVLQNLCEELTLAGLSGAKISGSGLGDCVVGLGHISQDFISKYTSLGVERMHVSMTQQGVQCEQV